MVEKGKEEVKSEEKLRDEKKQKEVENDLGFMGGKYEMAKHIYQPFMKLSEQLAGKVNDISKLRDATSEIVSAMIRPLESGETRDRAVELALGKFSIGADEMSSIKKLINNPNVDMATGLSNLLEFFGHKYANVQSSPNEQAFIEGLKDAQARVGKAKEDGAKKNKPGPEASEAREGSIKKGAGPSKEGFPGERIEDYGKQKPEKEKGPLGRDEEDENVRK